MIVRLRPCRLAAALLCAAAAAAGARAQQPRPAPTSAPAQAPPAAQVPAGRIAVIHSNKFADPKAGVRRLVAAFEGINKEFQPQRDEINRLGQQYERLAAEINSAQGGAPALAAKADQAETLKRDIDRKQQDAQSAYGKRVRALTTPIFDDLGKALQAYARQRQITLVLDVGRIEGAVLVADPAADITDAFIADYNQRNPATGK
jgi:Skp family chaperone for outer membrane proteins